MRAKQLLTYVPLSKPKLFFERVTASRLILCYFLFSVLHAVAQVSLQVHAFSINARAANFLWNIVQESDSATEGFTVLKEGLWECNSIPSSLSVSSCNVIWSGAPANDTQYTMSNVVEVSNSFSLESLSSFTVTSTSASSPSETKIPADNSILADGSYTTVTVTVPPSSTSSHAVPKSTSISVVPRSASRTASIPREYFSESDTHILDSSGTTQVNVPGLGLAGDVAILDNTCLMALNWPVSTLDNTKREDIVFIAFNVWLLGMSVVALLNESIPHILASLLTHVLATCWSGLQINQTARFHAAFARLTTEGACKPLNLLPNYWKQRSDAEISSLVLNCVALAVSAFLTWRLTKAFSWKTFKRIGASLSINRQYTVVLIFSISIQLSLFFIVASISLWIDQLYNGSIAHLSTHIVAYHVLMILVLVLLIPWLTMGWISVRRELKLPMLVFLGFAAIYLGAWGAMFASKSFRWTFTQWTFFSIMASASVSLTALTLICGTVCRIGFGKGLTRCLTAEEPLLGDNFVSVDSSDVEKVNFPSIAAPIPTYSATFGSGDEVPPPAQMNFGALGPRFYRKSLEPFEPQPPAPIHTRTLSSASKSSHAGSIGSTSSEGSSNRDGMSEERLVRNHRWVIE